MNRVTRVRRVREDDRDPLVDLWERSVRATHHFLEDRDVVALRPLVAEELAGDDVDWWVLESDVGALMGGLSGVRAQRDRRPVHRPGLPPPGRRHDVGGARTTRRW